MCVINFFVKDVFLIMHVSLYGYLHVSPGARRDQNIIISDPLELELQVVMRCGCWEPKLGLLVEQEVLLPADPSGSP